MKYMYKKNLSLYTRKDDLFQYIMCNMSRLRKAYASNTACTLVVIFPCAVLSYMYARSEAIKPILTIEPPNFKRIFCLMTLYGETLAMVMTLQTSLVC